MITRPEALRRWLVGAGLILALASCATVGRRFPSMDVDSIVIGRTTQAEVRRQFGEPWRVGIEDGQKTWTYGFYKYSLFKPARTRDLVIRFGDGNLVSSYSYSATNSE